MKALILLFTFVSVTAQTQWNQDFNSPFSFSNHGIIGDTLDFQVDSTNQLKLQAIPQTHSSFLAFPSAINHQASYEFELSLGFNPSSSNYAKVFVWSDVANPSSANNGVFIAIGGTTEDRISLYGLNQGQNQLLVESTADFLNEVNLELKIKLELDSLGNYHLWVQKGLDSMIYLGNGFFFSSSPSNYFSLECIYTSTRSDKFTFDKILVAGSEMEDKEGPRILRLRTNSRKEILLNFSLDSDTSELKDPDHFRLFPGNHKTYNLRYRASYRELTLSFDESLTDSLQYALEITSIPDESGNLLDTILNNLSFYKPKKGDIIFSEVLFDAEPPVQLPEEEGIEIYNRRSFPIVLNDWILSNGNLNFRIDSFSIKGHSFAWIANNPEPWSSIVPEQDILPAPLASNFLLTEEGKVSLSDSSSFIIDQFHYSKEMFNSEPKKLGGWTLERSALTSPCGSPNLWSESIHSSGGTPGSENSITETYVDENPPYLEYFGKVNDSTLQLVWSEDIHLTGIPIVNEDFAILDSFWVNPLIESRLFLQFQAKIPASNSFKLELGSYLKDCVGNPSPYETIELSFPEPLLSEGLQIEEVLFNPNDRQVEYVEIVNRGLKTFDIKGLRFWIASDTFSSQMNSSAPLVESRIVQAGERVCLTKQAPSDFDDLFYSSKHYFVEIQDFPNLLSTESSIGITSISLENIDKATYNVQFHSLLLRDTKGYSLQRISFNNEAHQALDWRSAEPSPGIPSAQIEEAENYVIQFNEECWKRRSNENLQLEISKPLESALLDLRLFALNGNEICKITERHWISGSTNISWNGLRSNGEVILPGVYFLVANLYFENGTKRKEVHAFSICD